MSPLPRGLNRVLVFYFLGYRLLIFTISCLTIYRFGFWENTSGRCFIGYIGGNGGFDKRDDAVSWL
jgi:hypothetical protein